MMQTIREEMLASELPESLRNKVQAKPNERVQITVRPAGKSLVDKLLGIADRASVEAQKNGLTEKKLEQLLKDA